MGRVTSSSMNAVFSTAGRAKNPCNIIISTPYEIIIKLAHPESRPESRPTNGFPSVRGGFCGSRKEQVFRLSLTGSKEKRPPLYLLLESVNIRSTECGDAMRTANNLEPHTPPF
jgi:hypothetical protein